MKYSIARKDCPVIAIVEGISPKKVLEEYLEKFYLTYSHKLYKGKEHPYIEIKIEATKVKIISTQTEHEKYDYYVSNLEGKKHTDNYYKIQIQTSIKYYTPSTNFEKQKLRKELNTWLNNKKEEEKFYLNYAKERVSIQQFPKENPEDICKKYNITIKMAEGNRQANLQVPRGLKFYKKIYPNGKRTQDGTYTNLTVGVIYPDNKDIVKKCYSELKEKFTTTYYELVLEDILKTFSKD